ncbi:flagellar basal body-associated protein FliL [Salinarimonas sp.]|uniref:flagellar basal body-associated protein FliL n=1 Tax=Salinarimonas sp. TaxID=2766526 RepID=UPI0032D969C0
MAKKPRKGEEAEVEGEGGDAAPSKKKKLVLIAAAAAVLLIGGGAGAFFLLSGGEEPAEGAVAEAEPAQTRPAAFIEVPQMTVNLSPEPNEDRPRFLRFTARLEVSEEKAVSEIEPLMPRIEDAFQTYVRELRPSDLHGSAGVYRLREELLRRVNIAVHPAKVDAVLFGEVVVQ